MSACPGAQEREALLSQLEARFAANMHRDHGMSWSDLVERLEVNPEAVASLRAMEDSGGEPDVIGRDMASGAFLFGDCAAESPKERRSVCYDGEAREARKQHSPDSSAVELATAMGVVLMTEGEYATLQALEPFDTKTSSWLLTPPEVRALGGAIFGDRRYDRVFTYHNGAESYYAARGCRCVLSV